MHGDIQGCYLSAAPEELAHAHADGIWEGPWGKDGYMLRNTDIPQLQHIVQVPRKVLHHMA